MRGAALIEAAPRTARLQYLDALRGVAVIVMVLAHVSDSWTAEPYRKGEFWYHISFVGGVASPLFLFLAGVALAMAANAKGAAAARRRGWQIFVLGLLFRLQSQILGLGPLDNLFKVDMLNIMGLSMVAAAYTWQAASRQSVRIAILAAATTSIAMMTPIVRDLAWLASLPDPLEAYLRPEGRYAAFPFFPWGGFLFGGAIAGDLVHAVRVGRINGLVLQNGLAMCGGAGVILAWLASFQPPLYESASFWHDSPTFFFIRLGLATLLLPMAWVGEQLLAARVFSSLDRYAARNADSVLVAGLQGSPRRAERAKTHGDHQPTGSVGISRGRTPWLVALGRSSLFVYWVHVEMVYGVVAEPIKRSLPLWLSIIATATLCVGLYGLVRLKNRYLSRLWPARKLQPAQRLSGGGAG